MCFDSPLHSVNFLTCHDGFTLYDLVAYDRKHNEANGHRNTDGAGDNRSWNCGWEGDDGVPDEVMALRQRQLRNAWCLLATSHGVPMVAMGDEFGRTQRGNNNAYNQDNETSWVDWERRDRFADLERFVGRAARAARTDTRCCREPSGGATRCGSSAPPARPIPPDHSRSLAWTVGDLYVIVNAFWEPLAFCDPGRRAVESESSTPRSRHRTDIVDQDAARAGRRLVTTSACARWSSSNVVAADRPDHLADRLAMPQRAGGAAFGAGRVSVAEQARPHVGRRCVRERVVAQQLQGVAVVAQQALEERAEPAPAVARRDARGTTSASRGAGGTARTDAAAASGRPACP